MKLKTFAAALAATTIAGSAFAADLPSRKVAPAYIAPVPVFTWTGFYIGLNAGYTWSDRNGINVLTTDTGAGGFGGAQNNGVLPFAVNLKNEGALVGGQVGYNWQMGSAVFGIETDIQGVFGGGKTLNVAAAAPAFAPTFSTYSRKTDWLGTLRARVGFTITPAFLLYATGGLAYGGTKLSFAAAGPTYAPPMFGAVTSSKTSLGWTAGVGGEYAFSNNWSAKVEWLYYDLGRQTTAPIVYAYGANVTTAQLSARNSGHIVRAGLNYRFGWGAGPVVAKY